MSKDETSDNRRFRVFDAATREDVFGGEITLHHLRVVYPMASCSGEADFSQLGIGEATSAVSVTPSRGQGRYRVHRTV